MNAESRPLRAAAEAIAAELHRAFRVVAGDRHLDVRDADLMEWHDLPSDRRWCAVEVIERLLLLKVIAPGEGREEDVTRESLERTRVAGNRSAHSH